MSVYWKTVNRGQNLILSEEEGKEEIVGGYRDTKRGIDAYAPVSYTHLRAHET